MSHMLMKSAKLMEVQRYRVIGNPDDLPQFIAVYKYTASRILKN
jgi:hypothetical protein